MVFHRGANDRSGAGWVASASATWPTTALPTNIERVKHRAELEQRVGDAIADAPREAC